MKVILKSTISFQFGIMNHLKDSEKVSSTYITVHKFSYQCITIKCLRDVNITFLSKMDVKTLHNKVIRQPVTCNKQLLIILRTRISECKVLISLTCVRVSVCELVTPFCITIIKH